MSRVTLFTTKLSGVTSPETTDSPKPKLESMTITERSPLAGWMVNITPAVYALAIFCTPTLSARAGGGAAGGGGEVGGGVGGGGRRRAPRAGVDRKERRSPRPTAPRV